MDRAGNPVSYRFGEFELDALRRLLVTRADSKPVPVTAKVFDALLYLVERPGELVEKRELMEALWPSVVVEDGNLTQAIHTLRRVLGERAGEHRYIVTVPGRGYRFVAKVEPADRPAVAHRGPTTPTAPPTLPARAATRRQPAARVWAALFALGALGALVALAAFIALPSWRAKHDVAAPSAAQTTSLAVLPFADLSPDGDQAYFADGLAEEILNLLVRIPDLRVIVRTSSFSFRGAKADIQRVRERLGVTHVLEGSVRKAGDRIRVTAQLIDAKTNGHLWSASYDRELRDVFEVQSAIATAIAAALDIRLSGAERLAAQGGTTNPAAHEQYLQGRYFLNRRQASDVERARQSFEEATRLDAGYSRAWSGLAATWYIEASARQLASDEAQRWHEAALRALESGSDLAEAHARVAQYLLWAGQIAQARHHFHEAIRLQPSDPLVRAMQMSEASVDGRLSDAVELATQIAANDPVSAVNRAILGALLLATGRHHEAAAELRKADDLGLVSADNRNFLCKALLLDGRRDEALAAVEGLQPGPRAAQCIALVHEARGERAQAESILAHLTASAEARPDDWVLHITIAELQASMERVDAAFASLQSAAASAVVSGSVSRSWQFVSELQISPFLAPLHADPRWEALLAARRASWERQAAR